MMNSMEEAFEKWWKEQHIEEANVPGILKASYKELTYRAWLDGFKNGYQKGEGGMWDLIDEYTGRKVRGSYKYEETASAVRDELEDRFPNKEWNLQIREKPHKDVTVVSNKAGNTKKEGT